MADKLTDLPEHIEATVAAISGLHAEHHRNAGHIQRLVSLTTAVLARPRTLGIMTVAVVGWIAANLGLLVSGANVFDAPPFPYLADAASIIALYLTTTILITQRHDDDLATRRDRLTLELAVLAEHKSTKIISLLEELRHRDRQGAGKRDEHAEALSEFAHPQAMLDQLQAAHQARDEGPG